MKKIIGTIILLLLIDVRTAHSGLCSSVANKSIIPDIKLETVVSNLDYPVHIANDGFHQNRIYIVEQDGLIQITDTNKKIKFKKPFLDIKDRVTSSGEKGLLSVAFHPDYPKDKRFFVNYTTENDGLYTIISEFIADNNLLTAKKSERILLQIKQPYGNHNGGQIDFGPDGFLYIGMGDGGSGNDPLGNGQNINTLLGTILRIDVNHKSGKSPYAIPVGNPFINKKKRDRKSGPMDSAIPGGSHLMQQLENSGLRTLVRMMLKKLILLKKVVTMAGILWKATSAHRKSIKTAIEQILKRQFIPMVMIWENQ